MQTIISRKLSTPLRVLLVTAGRWASGSLGPASGDLLTPGNPAPALNLHAVTQTTQVSMIYDEAINPAAVDHQTLAVHVRQTGSLLESFSVNGGV